MDRFGRPAWDNYFMAMAMMASTRSLDPATKHGCVIVDDKKRILSMGYNGPPSGIRDSEVSFTRPDKYDWFEHSERNAIYNSNSPLEGSTVYVTGFPCVDCFRGLCQVGVKTVFYGPIGSAVVDSATVAAVEKIAKATGVGLIRYAGDYREPFKVLREYLDQKIGSQQSLLAENH